MSRKILKDVYGVKGKNKGSSGLFKLVIVLFVLTAIFKFLGG